MYPNDATERYYACLGVINVKSECLDVWVEWDISQNINNRTLLCSYSNTISYFGSSLSLSLFWLRLSECQIEYKRE